MIINKREECSDNLLSVIVLIIVIGMMVHSCVDGIVRTVELDEAKRKKSEPVYTVQYSQPAAFRLSTPTPEQMDHLHALMTVSAVKNANGEVPDGSEM